MKRILTFSSLSARLYGLAAVFGVGLVVLAGFALQTQWQSTRAARLDALEATAETLWKLIDTVRTSAAENRLSDAEAKALAVRQVVAMSHDKSNYFFVLDETGTVIGHPLASTIGSNLYHAKDSHGFAWLEAVLPRAISTGSASVEYSYPRAGETVSLPKIAVYRSYAPWHIVIGTGVYIDDLRAEFMASAWRLALVIAAVFLVLLLVATLVIRSVTRPTRALTAAMGRLAAGGAEADLPDGGSLAETRAMAEAMHVFRDAGQEKARLAREAMALRQTAEAERARQEAVQAAAAAAQQGVVQAVANGLSQLSQGDLTVRLPSEFPAEYEQLRQDFNAATEQLQSAIGVISTNTGAIRSGTAEIVQAADDLSRRTEQQAASLEQTAAAMDEITTTVRKSAEGAGRARKVVRSAKAAAEHSGAVVGDAVTAMSAIEASSKQVSQIIGVIDEIAFQTNLLALNAGVEAARAGEAGRGFAVVASEVRALAQRSAASAKEIKGLISVSSQQVGRGVDLVAQTGKSLERIVTEVAEIDGIVAEIASSAMEQAAGLAQVNTAVNQMDQVTQQNAAMVEQSTAAAHALEHETAELARLTGRFRIAADTARRAA